jgi:hypothetical protein
MAVIVLCDCCNSGSVRLMRLMLWLTLVLGSMLTPLPGRAADGSYLSQLTERAERERLADHPVWQALLHYEPQLFSPGVESQVDSESFFLSPVGKFDPQAELNATLAAFFAIQEDEGDQNAQCRFIARYHWLDQALGFDPHLLPQLPCRRFHRWFDDMNPERLTLIFPAAYLNNPASMFGHTLLRVDARSQDERTRLLAYTINYAAETRLQRGLNYVYRGLFGGYQGKFSISPYYLKVKEYSDIENRDIWEYGLNLTPEEISRMLRHVWEMHPARFDYYFLDENCSYHLLSLLEVARPGLDLTSRFSLTTIPSETIRVVAEAGLIEEVRYRPARITVLRERAALMDDNLQDLAKSMTAGGPDKNAEQLRQLSPADRARVMELALDYAAYLQSPKFGGETLAAGTVPDLLLARSRLEVPDQTPVIPQPGIPPGEGHNPARIGIGFGFEDRRQFIEFTASPGYHEIFDPEGGFTPGASVSLLKTAVRYYPEKSEAELERFDLIDIMSLSPWGRLVRPYSWKVGLGAMRKHITADDRPLLGRFDGGVGISRDFSEKTTAYALAEGTVEFSNRFSFVVAPGVGPELGLVHDFSDSWRTGLIFRWQLFFLDEWRNDFETLFRNRITIHSQSAMGLDLSWKREFGNCFTGLKVYWVLYF